ncbi:MAG: tRNA (adenosine(37)-N6)-dimethylallyltransferase MiaA [Hyphomicrobium sp.]
MTRPTSCDHARKPILIAGPTASGKSALALALAERFDGLIINADSMQVYRELVILSARPSAADEARAPHVLYGHVPAAESYSAARFVSEARGALANAARAGRVPIIVGGTGLYFKALTEGLSPIPEIDADIRAHWRGEAARLGAVALHAHLSAIDPSTAAGLNPNDSQRIVRALEVLASTGRPLRSWQDEPGDVVLQPEACTALVISDTRERLTERADLRFDAMMAAGALEEARAIEALGLDAELPAMRALGLRPLIAAVRGQLPLSDAIAAGKAETRSYIKRQQTWAKRYMISWKSIKTQDMECLDTKIIKFIQGSH